LSDGTKKRSKPNPIGKEDCIGPWTENGRELDRERKGTPLAKGEKGSKSTKVKEGKRLRGYNNHRGRGTCRAIQKLQVMTLSEIDSRDTVGVKVRRLAP